MRELLADRIQQEHNTENHRAILIEASRKIGKFISMGRGDPDLPTPPHIVEAAREALDQKHFGYSPWLGFPDLRKAIADKLRHKNGIAALPEEIIVTVGAQEAVVISLLSLLNPGEEILMPDPRYTPYDVVAEKLAGAKVVPIPTYMDDEFQVRIDELEKKLTPRTKAILLISPNNPTGQVLDCKKAEEIAAFAIKHDLAVISDQLYEEALEPGVINPSIAALPDMAGRTITINGFSKTYNMTGWRVGYLHAPMHMVKAMVQLKYALTISAPSISQRAALAAITGPQDCVSEMNDIYCRRRALVTTALKKMNIQYCPPRGAFYVFARIPEIGMSGFEFCQKLLDEEKVLVFPGTAFGESTPQFIRISLLAPEEQMAEGMARMQSFIKRSAK